MRIALLVIVPIIFILIYFVTTLSPTISTKFGGAANISSFLIVLLTYFYVVLTGKIVQQMIKAQKEERRPFIVVDIEIEEHLVSLVVQNIGKTPAKNLIVNLMPELPTATGQKLSEAIFAKPILFFPPGKLFRSFINTSVDLFKSMTNPEVKVYLSYNWDGRDDPVKESYVINFDQYKDRLFIKSKGIKDINDNLEKLNKNLSILIEYFKDMLNKEDEERTTRR